MKEAIWKMNLGFLSRINKMSTLLDDLNAGKVARVNPGAAGEPIFVSVYPERTDLSYRQSMVSGRDLEAARKELEGMSSQARRQYRRAERNLKIIGRAAYEGPGSRWVRAIYSLMHPWLTSVPCEG